MIVFVQPYLDPQLFRRLGKWWPH